MPDVVPVVTAAHVVVPYFCAKRVTLRAVSVPPSNRRTPDSRAPEPYLMVVAPVREGSALVESSRTKLVQVWPKASYARSS